MYENFFSRRQMDIVDLVLLANSFQDHTLSYIVFSNKTQLRQINQLLCECQNETPLVHVGVSNSVLSMTSSHEKKSR